MYLYDHSPYEGLETRKELIHKKHTWQKAYIKAHGRDSLNKWIEKKYSIKIPVTRADQKRLVFERYGNHCVCCGETDLDFLTLDHRENDGGQLRRFRSQSYTRIIFDGFPNYLQVLCWNCNMGKSAHKGVCPHIIRKYKKLAESLGPPGLEPGTSPLKGACSAVELQAQDAHGNKLGA